MRPFRTAIVVLVAAGCVSAAREPSVRTVHGRSPAEVVAAALDALAVAGVQDATVHPGADDGRAVIRAVLVAGGYERHPFLVEVRVDPGAGAVRVAVLAEPAPNAPDAFVDALLRAGGDSTARTGCGCAADDPVGGEARPRDNLLLLAQGRRVVGAVLAALDARLR
ncbi:MAG: hypothetical protein EPN53_02065 [Acidobacteria bacterium]|nr:MAG: hypothetical protein EPN53_02065 [Acidobacteriota bacterium]